MTPLYVSPLFTPEHLTIRFHLSSSVEFPLFFLEQSYMSTEYPGGPVPSTTKSIWSLPLQEESLLITFGFRRKKIPDPKDNQEKEKNVDQGPTRDGEKRDCVPRR